MYGIKFLLKESQRTLHQKKVNSMYNSWLLSLLLLLQAWALDLINAQACDILTKPEQEEKLLTAR